MWGGEGKEKERESNQYRTTSRVDLKFPDPVSAGARDIISKLLVHDPNKRLPLSCVPAHPWIRNNTQTIILHQWMSNK